MTTFSALGVGVSVEIDEDVDELARALIRSYPTVDSAEVHYHVMRNRVLRNGQALPVSDRRDVIPMFEMDLYEQVVARAAAGWILHAAALSVNGRALVLCGASGAGKTTMTLALTQRGYRLLTEEVVWISADGVVRGLPRPIHVPADSSQRAQIAAAWTQLPYPIRGRDGVHRENVLVVPPRDVFELGPLPLHTIVRMGHGPDWPVYLQPSPHHVAFQRLWDRSLRQDDSGLTTATEVLRRFGSYEMSSRAESEALGMIEPLLK